MHSPKKNIWYKHLQLLIRVESTNNIIHAKLNKGVYIPSLCLDPKSIPYPDLTFIHTSETINPQDNMSISFYVTFRFAFPCIFLIASRCASSICPLRIILSSILARCICAASRACFSASFWRRSFNSAIRCCSTIYACACGGVTSRMVPRQPA
jgi:hypothetical protein